MKNYLVKSVYQVADADWKVLDRSHEKNLFENYLEMHRLSVGSYKKFLGGDWELKFFTGRVDHINQAFEKTFWAIHDLWHQEPCNILYTDPDTMAIKPIEPWGHYDKFMMFNYTDPRELTTDNVYGKSYQHFFNAGVRYFPATMSEQTWEIGKSIAANWDSSTYDTEQIILNEMLWSQDMTVDQVLDPAMAWQALPPKKQVMPDVNFGNQWNQCHISEAKILHFHSSRGSDSRLQIMQGLGGDTQMKTVFENIIRTHYWSDTICGSGSTLENTQTLIQQLVPFLQRHGITSMADVPCGDFSWMSQVQFPKGFRYMGGDIVGFMIQENRAKYPNVDFEEFDLSQDTLPDVDLLFCRDCLFHFSHSDIQKTLDNISRSSVKYVMFTSYYNGNNHDIQTGQFRELDFLKAPFDFPEPIDFIDEHISGERLKRRLCLWSTDTIKNYLKQ